MMWNDGLPSSIATLTDPYIQVTYREIENQSIAPNTYDTACQIKIAKQPIISEHQ